MAEKDGEGRYQHEFEDLGGNPDNTSAAADLGDDIEIDLDLEAEDDQASREAAGDDEAGGDDGDGGGKEAAGEGEGEDGGDGAGSDEDIEAEIRDALARQQASQSQQETEALKAEVKELREKLGQREASEQVQTKQREAEAKIADLRQRLRKAQEDGETEASLDLQEQLIDAKVELREATRAAPADDKAADKAADKDAGKGSDTGQRRRPEAPEAAQRWVTRNPWFWRGENPEAADTVTVIEQKLMARGMSPASEAFYQVLDKQLRRIHPELDKDAGKAGDKEGEQKEQRRRNGGPPNGVTQAGARKGGKVRITKTDLANMKACGLDPDDPEVVKQYAREKKALEAQERR